jgi:phospholipase C
MNVFRRAFRRFVNLPKRAAVFFSLALMIAPAFGFAPLSPAFAQPPASQTPNEPPTTTPIKHFIFLMQENHSFDNYFGTYPGADGIPTGVCMPVDPFDSTNANCVKPFHIGDTDVQMDDPDHSTETHRVQYNQGQMNGFVYALDERNQDGRLAMGYYNEQDLPYYWNVAGQYVLFDRMFSSAAGGSDINHFYWVTGTSGQPQDGGDQQTLLANTPTIFDQLEEKGISWKFYVQNYEPNLTYRTIHEYPGNRASQVIWVPLLNFDRFIDNPELNKHIVDMSEFYNDLDNGTLPDVAYIAPSGPSEHPPSNLVSGQRFIKTLIQSLMQSPYWDNSAFMWAYDDWGGWYDHVLPPQVDEYGYGMRVPALLVSAYARHGYIDHTTLDFTSALKFIEENWGLSPLAERDAQAQSIAGAFDFSQPPRPAVIIPFGQTEQTPKPQPHRNVIYGAYGFALVLGFALLMMVFIPSAWSGKRKALKAAKPKAEEDKSTGSDA